MHIFRWLMTHPIVTAWILAALAILLNLNMGTKGGHDEVKHEGKVTHEVVESEKHSVSNKSGTESQASGNETENSSSGQAVVAAASSLQASAEANTLETAVVGTSTAKDATTTTSSKEQVAEAGSEQVKTEGLASMKTEQLIQLAREAFWHGDKEKSVAIYQALIEREPASLAHKGELANVYWHQEKQKESAALYAEIAVPMVKAGKTREVSNMLGFIGVFFPEKAEELQGLISQ